MLDSRIYFFEGTKTCEINNCTVIESGKSLFEINKDIYNGKGKVVFDLVSSEEPEHTITVKEVFLRDGSTKVIFDKAFLSLPIDKTMCFNVGDIFYISEIDYPKSTYIRLC